MIVFFSLGFISFLFITIILIIVIIFVVVILYFVFLQLLSCSYLNPQVLLFSNSPHHPTKEKGVNKWLRGNWLSAGDKPPWIEEKKVQYEKDHLVHTNFKHRLKSITIQQTVSAFVPLKLAQHPFGANTGFHTWVKISPEQDSVS